jgi:hypothetical protein
METVIHYKFPVNYKKPLHSVLYLLNIWIYCRSNIQHDMELDIDFFNIENNKVASDVQLCCLPNTPRKAR